MSTKYSKEFKDSIISRMLPPHNASVPDLARETGIPKDTLYTWRLKYRNTQDRPGNHSRPADPFSSDEKLAIVIETASLSEVELADKEIVTLYKRRWDIEVFFKITKSYLQLAKEFQSRSYDALVAHTTIVFARYTMLALARRMNEDPRTLGTLFHASCDELRQVGFGEALMLLLGQLEQLVKDFAEASAEPIMAMLKAFVTKIPALLRRPLLLPAAKL
jgi:transposase-like protein